MRLNHSRSGTSLVELLVALVLFALFGAIALVQLSSNGRSLSATAERLEAQSALWHGTDAIATELRPVSPGSGDLLLATDSALWYRGHVAAGVLCSAPSGSTLQLLPDSLASGMRPSSGVNSAQAGDLLYVFDEGAQQDAADDQWLPLVVSSISKVSNLCAGTPYLDPVRDAGRAGYRVQVLSATIPSTISAGAAVRILRPSRLALYRSAPDWFLGWADWNSSLGGWNVIQPVAGKYRPYGASPRPTGIGLALADSLAIPIVSAGTVPSAASVNATLRSQVLTRNVGVGPVTSLRTDSLSTRVALRNRP